MNINKKSSGYLLTIASDLNSSLDIKFILDKIIEKRTLSLLSSKRATIYQLDNKQEYLMPIATLDSPFKAKVMSENVVVKSSLAGNVVQAKKGMIFNDTSSHPEAFHIPGTPDVDNENLMVLPLLIENEIWGTLNLYRSEELYTKEDLKFAEMFALYAGSAIYNAQIFQELTNEIKEHKKVEEDLMQQDYIIKSASSAIATSDLDGKMTYGNAKFMELWGFNSTNEFIGNNFSDYWIVGDTYKGIMSALENIGVWEGDIIAKRKDGSTFDVQVSASMVYNNEGSPISLMSSSVDITFQKQAEAELVKERDFSKTLVEKSPIFFVTIDKNKKIVAMNKKMLDVCGYRLEEVINRKYIPLFIAHDQQKMVRSLFDTLINKEVKGSTYNENYIQTKDGRIILLEWHGNQLLDSRGKFEYFIGVGVDITKKRKVENALKENEEKYISLFENANDSIFLIKNEKIVEVNKTAENMFGRKREELINIKPWDPIITAKQFDDNISKEDGPHQLAEALKRNTAKFEWVHKKKDGTPFYVEISLRKIKLKGEDYAHAIIRDNTEKKQIEKKRIESERKYRTLVENSLSVMWMTKEDGSTTFISGNVKKIYGYSPEELYKGGQKLWFERIHKDDRELVIDNFNKLFKNKSHYVTDYRIRHKNGNYIWLRDKSNIVLEEYGEKIACGAFTDITEEKNNIINLINSENKFSTMFQTSPNVITISNVEDGTMLDINNVGVKALGYKKDEIIGRSSLDLELVSQEDRDKLINLLRKDGYYSSVEFPVKLKSGAIRIGLFYGQIIEISNKQYLFQTIVDITDRKTSEIKLYNAYEEIKELKDKLQAENIFLKKSVDTNDLHIDIVGTSPQIKSVVSRALQVAPQDSNVLILGETGTGKELIARGIHDASKRKDKTLVTVNCAAIPDNLIESELFGHEKGSFTDAQTKKMGLFEIADGSTLFLDEIGELPLNLQPKLLRVIENREISRIGSNKPFKIDVRIIAATNQDLAELIKKKKFRRDLFYRLHVFPIDLPPLRIRKQDIKPIVEKFIDEFNQHMGKNISTISKKALDDLDSYNWPGNVRELKNVIERSMITSYGSNLKLELNHVTQSEQEELITLRDVERNHILNVLDKTFWKISGKGGAAEILGLNRNTLNSRIKKLEIKKP